MDYNSREQKKSFFKGICWLLKRLDPKGSLSFPEHSIHCLMFTKIMLGCAHSHHSLIRPHIENKLETGRKTLEQSRL